MIGEFISLLFLSRDVAHKEHLRTQSYAQHIALGDFYDKIVDLADNLAEAYQGRNGIIDIPGMDDEDVGDIVQQLKRYLDWIEKNRYQAVPKEDSAIQNIVDEIVSLYLSTLYKLQNLK